MKRLIAAVSFAVLATPVLAETGKPYEQVDVNRALPKVAERTVAPVEYPLNGSAPYEQFLVDRGFTGSSVSRTQVAASGATRSDVEIAAPESVGAAIESPAWEYDHNFIAPPQ